MTIRLTTTVAKTLAAFLADPDAPQYGMSLMDQTGLASGTLYPILMRLQKEGWLEASPEDIDPAIEGRPRRKNYLLTQTGRQEARRALDELHKATQVSSRSLGRALPAM
ncbi:PadR family transcriptional regulator [Streptomyces arenae]|uniref:PadR family transcriptional regulator n=1 Tax=Streptomyces arenae TaxID=29301 RepID=UPI002658178F|nr:helix-turn-helix transcriptional regulator [Streptomyces arenae]MCG7203987.1 PadR family transcriptional regulator [Streptomyces arenae]